MNINRIGKAVRLSIPENSQPDPSAVQDILAHFTDEYAYCDWPSLLDRASQLYDEADDGHLTFRRPRLVEHLIDSTESHKDLLQDHTGMGYSARTNNQQQRAILDARDFLEALDDVRSALNESKRVDEDAIDAIASIEDADVVAEALDELIDEHDHEGPDYEADDVARWLERARFMSAELRDAGAISAHDPENAKRLVNVIDNAGQHRSTLSDVRDALNDFIQKRE